MKKINLVIPAFVCWMSTGITYAQQSDSLDEVFASRGKGEITHREFDARMTRIPERDHAAFLRDGNRLERILAELLLQKQMVVEATAADFQNNPVVQARMELAAMTELATAWLEHYVATASVADLETMAHEYYLLHQDEFVSQETRDVSHILINNEDRSDEEALLRAETVMEILEEDPSGFTALVAEYTDDTASAANQGMYTEVKKGDMVPEFERTAFSLSPGEISEPVKTRFGFHIIRLERINESRQLSFEEVKTSLMERQRREHEKRVRVDYLASFASLETNLTEESVRTMLSRYVDDSYLSEVKAEDSE